MTGRTAGTTSGPYGELPARTPLGKALKPFLAPLLVTGILAIGEFEYGILEGHSEVPFLNNTAVAILSAILAEVVLRRLATGRWPPWTTLASAYITGISVGILLRTVLWWPYVLCSLLSISSKYALRVQGRHLWNPSNLGVSLLLLLLPEAVAPLSQQWGNAIWVPLIILALGSAILYLLGRLHITLTYAAAFCLLSLFRSALTQENWINEIAIITQPAYILFMYFMITDPKTTTRTPARQCLVAVLVALVETTLRLYRVIHAPYYALFIVAPVTNLAEIFWDKYQEHRAQRGTGPLTAAALSTSPAANTPVASSIDVSLATPANAPPP
jgi:Na+-translocating ferredoxin:NAD+ oxidoreductase RnfD subunit